jgi:hypothetical protein
VLSGQRGPACSTTLSRQTTRSSLRVCFLPAPATAKTYSEQIQELIRVGATLRRIAAEPDVHKDRELRDAINQMYGYLAKLALEYQKHYLPVARQQRVDEERLKLLAKDAAKTPAPEKLTAVELTPEELAAEVRQPMRAGRMLQNAKLFPGLAAFRDNGKFECSDFRRGYETAKRLLEKHAGIRRQNKKDQTTCAARISKPSRPSSLGSEVLRY